MNYKVPSWCKRKSFAGVTDEQLSAWERETEQIAMHNKRLYTDALNNWKQMLHLAEKTWGLKSKEYRYIDAAKIEEPPDLSKTLHKAAKSVADAREKQVRAQQRRERENALAAQEEKARAIRNARRRETDRQRRERRRLEAEEARTAWLTQGPL